MTLFIIGFFVGALAGFFTCAILTASKMGALQDQLDETKMRIDPFDY